MNKLEKRRLKNKILDNKKKYAFLFLGMFIFLLSIGYGALNMNLAINGQASINYKIEHYVEECDYESGSITATYKKNSIYNTSPLTYNATLLLHNDGSQNISNFKIYIYGPSDLDMTETSFVDSYTVDNGVLVLTPASWCSTLYNTYDLTFDLHLVTDEADFEPYAITVDGCLVYGDGSAIGGGGTSGTELKSLTISPNSITLEEGNTYNLTLTTNPTGLNPNVTWSSNNTNVATVNNGVVTALGSGTATITASSGNISTTCSVTVVSPEEVIPELTGLAMNLSNSSIEVGETLQLSYTRTPSDAVLETISWSSGNNSIATVNQNGLVTGISVGSTTITAYYGDISTTCNLTVTQSSTALTALSFNTSSVEMDVDEYVTLILTKTPSNSPDTITWRSSNSSVATVTSSGVVHGVGGGTATITASSGSISATCTVKVNQAVSSDVLSISFAPGDWYSGTNLQFVITIENLSSSSISNIEFEVALPSSTSYSFWHGNEVTNSGNVITWHNSIAANGSTQIRGQATLPSGSNANNYIHAATTLISYK